MSEKSKLSWGVQAPKGAYKEPQGHTDGDTPAIPIKQEYASWGPYPAPAVPSSKDKYSIKAQRKENDSLTGKSVQDPSSKQPVESQSKSPKRTGESCEPAVGLKRVRGEQESIESVLTDLEDRVNMMKWTMERGDPIESVLIDAVEGRVRRLEQMLMELMGKKRKLEGRSCSNFPEPPFTEDSDLDTE
jgi:hypothetical protein